MNIYKKYVIFCSVILFLFYATSCGARRIKSSEDNCDISQEEYEMDELSETKNYMKEENRSRKNSQLSEKKLIKIGNINFETSDIKSSHSFLNKLVEKYNAYINDENEHSSKTKIEQTFVVKIPKDVFDAFLNELLADIDNLNSRKVYIQDVTEDFIDIVARLKIKKDTEETYLRLLSMAKTVRDVLDIQDQIQTIRSEIESIEGRLKYLEHSVNYSTLNINMYQFIADNQSRTSSSFFVRIRSSLKTGLQIFLEVIIAILNMWVFILILLIFIFVLKKRILYKRRGKNEYK